MICMLIRHSTSHSFSSKTLSLYHPLTLTQTLKPREKKKKKTKKKSPTRNPHASQTPKQKEKKKTDLAKTQRHLHLTDYPNSHTTPSSPFSPNAQTAAPHRSPSPTPARPSSSRSPSGTPARTLPCRCSRIVFCTVSCEGGIPRGERRGAALSVKCKG